MEAKEQFQHNIQVLIKEKPNGNRYSRWFVWNNS